MKEEMEQFFKKINKFINLDGGQIDFVSYDHGIVYVKLGGACVGCSLIDYTIKDGVEIALKEEFPEVKQVIVIED